MTHNRFARILCYILSGLVLVACGGGGGGGDGGGSESGGTSTPPPSRLLFKLSLNNAVVSMKTDGTGTEALGNAGGYVATDCAAEPEFATFAGEIRGDLFKCRSMVSGNRVVFVDRGQSTDWDIVAMNPDGTNRTVLADGTGNQFPVTLIGDRLVYTGAADGVHVVRLDGSNDHRIGGWVVKRVGDRLVLADAGATWLADADGGNRVKLWDRTARMAAYQGDRIVLTDAGEWGNCSGALLVAVNADGSNLTQLFGPFGAPARDHGSSMRSIGTRGWHRYYFSISNDYVVAQFAEQPTGSGPLGKNFLKSVKLDGTDLRTLADMGTVETPYITGFSWPYVYTTEWSAIEGNLDHRMGVYNVTTQINSGPLADTTNLDYYRTFGNRIIAYRVNWIASSWSYQFDLYQCSADVSSCSILVSGLPGINGELIRTDRVIDNAERLVYQKNNNLHSFESSGQDQQLTNGAVAVFPAALLSDRVIYTLNGNVESVPLAGGGMRTVLAASTDAESYVGQFGDSVLVWKAGATASTMESIPLSGGEAKSLYSVGGGAADTFIGFF